jgi:hypothetical protein
MMDDLADTADLYDSTGAYVGTLADLGSLADLAEQFDPADGQGFDAEQYDAVVRAVVARHGVTEWPHGHADSSGTPWAWRWAGNAVQVWRHGGLYAALYPTWGKARPRKRSPFPRMVNAE